MRGRGNNANSWLYQAGTILTAGVVVIIAGMTPQLLEQQAEQHDSATIETARASAVRAGDADRSNFRGGCPYLRQRAARMRKPTYELAGQGARKATASHAYTVRRYSQCRASVAPVRIVLIVYDIHIRRPEGYRKAYIPRHRNDYRHNIRQASVQL